MIIIDKYLPFSNHAQIGSELYLYGLWNQFLTEFRNNNSNAIPIYEPMSINKSLESSQLHKEYSYERPFQKQNKKQSLMCPKSDAVICFNAPQCIMCLRQSKHQQQ